MKTTINLTREGKGSCFNRRMNEMAFCNKRIDIVYLTVAFEDCKLSSKKHTTHFMRLLEESNFEFYTFLKIVKIIVKKKYTEIHADSKVECA